MLVAEISDTTLSTDRGSKRAGYAQAMIPAYRIVDVQRQQLISMSQPADGVYKAEETFGFGEPVAVPGTGSTITLVYEA